MNMQSRDIEAEKASQGNFSELFPFRWTELARRLDYLYSQIPCTTIFAIHGTVPEHFDAQNPPEGIPVGSKHAKLLDHLFGLPTKHKCKAYITDPTGKRKRCGHPSTGFREIVKHHIEFHDRKDIFACLVDDCFAVFDKIGNGRRHSVSMHAAKPMEEDVNATMEKNIVQRIVTVAEKQEEQKIARRQTDKRRRLGMRTSVKNALRILPKSCVLSVTSKMLKNNRRNRKLVSFLISPTKHTRCDISNFHSRYLHHEFIPGETISHEEAEWMAASALLDIHYGCGVVAYMFKRTFKHISDPPATANMQTGSEGIEATVIEPFNSNELLLPQHTQPREKRQGDDHETTMALDAEDL